MPSHFGAVCRFWLHDEECVLWLCTNWGLLGSWLARPTPRLDSHNYELDQSFTTFNSHDRRALPALNGADSHISRMAVDCTAEETCVSLAPLHVEIQTWNGDASDPLLQAVTHGVNPFQAIYLKAPKLLSVSRELKYEITVSTSQCHCYWNKFD